MLKNAIATRVICLVLAAAGLQAQNVFVVPGANSTGNNIAVFASSPFSNITGFTAGAGTFQIFAKPDGFVPRNTL